MPTETPPATAPASVAAPAAGGVAEGPTDETTGVYVVDVVEPMVMGNLQLRSIGIHADFSTLHGCVHWLRSIDASCVGGARAPNQARLRRKRPPTKPARS